MNVFNSFRGTEDEPRKYQGSLFRCPADIFVNFTNCEIWRPGMLIVRNISQVSLVGSTYDWHNCRSSRTSILCIPPPIARVHPAVDLSALRVSEANHVTLEVRQKWKICQKELDTFQNIPAV
jgi:hypothetical protein